jgi:hypothetical protein
MEWAITRTARCDLATTLYPKDPTLCIAELLCCSFSNLPSRKGLGIKIRASLDEEIGVGGLSEVPDVGMHFTPYVSVVVNPGPVRPRSHHEIQICKVR